MPAQPPFTARSELNARLSDLLKRLDEQVSGLDMANHHLVNSSGVDVKGFLVVRETLRGFVDESELTQVALALHRQSHQFTHDDVEQLVNALTEAITEIADAINIDRYKD